MTSCAVWLGSAAPVRSIRWVDGVLAARRIELEEQVLQVPLDRLLAATQGGGHLAVTTACDPSPQPLAKAHEV